MRTRDLGPIADELNVLFNLGKRSGSRIAEIERAHGAPDAESGQPSRQHVSRVDTRKTYLVGGLQLGITKLAVRPKSRKTEPRFGQTRRCDRALIIERKVLAACRCVFESIERERGTAGHITVQHRYVERRAEKCVAAE